MKSVVRASVLAVLLLPAPVLAMAQDSVVYASLAGRVVDPSGKAVPSVQVTAFAQATSRSYTAVASDSGTFRLAYLPSGEYRISADGGGFVSPPRDIALKVGTTYDLTLRMSLAGVQTTVNVNSPAAFVEEKQSEISGIVQQSEVAGLPFAGRNFLDLALLLPGVSPTNTGSTQALAETSEIVGQGYSVNSQRNFSNSFVVDGLSANDDAAGVAGNAFSFDVVREFQVVTSGGQAEFGRALGGYFNIVTRSGTNDLHGTAYGFLRNQRLNAANALSGTTLPLTQGQYGASLSGPVRRNRSFLFGNFEEQRLRTNGVITVTPVNAAAINARLIATGYKAPLLPVVNSATTQYPTTLHTDTAFARLDHSISDKDQLTIRYSFYKLSSLNARGTGGLNEISNGTSVFDVNHTLAVSNVATLGSTKFNETRAQFVYDSLSAPPNETIGPAVTVAGVAVFGRSTSSPTGRLNYLTEIVDNLLLQKGNHTFKVGADFLRNQNTITYPQSLQGNYSFACIYDTAAEAPASYRGAFCANSLYSGRYNTQGFTQNFGDATVEQSNPNFGGYVQDEWKVTPSLTLNLGARYDLEFLKTIETDKNNASPRVGLAWSPYESGRTVVRASYGLFYDRVPLRPLANALLSANNTTNPAQAHFLSYTFSSADTNAPVFPQTAIAPPPGAKPNYALMARHIKNPYAQQASLGIEQQLGRKGTLEVSYQHLRGEHLISSINTNINADGTRPDATRGNIKPYTSAFDSYFDGLELSLVQHPSTWAAARLSYTWSKAIDNLGEFFFSSPINNFNLRVDRSRSDDDQRHRVVFDGSLASSVAKSKHWSDFLTHEWRLAGVLQYYSRLPFNITTGTTTKQGTTQRPCVSGFTLAASAGTNPCTEALAGAVIGRNAGNGFDFFTLNARLSRTFSVTDRIRAEGMVEAFNALNHRNDMIPNATFGTGSFSGVATNAQFGRPTAVGDPRNIQVAARISF